MRKIAVILLLSIYGLGTLILPDSDFAYLCHLPDMYEQCRAEDPDINPADFVFEHLLNLEDVISHFEHEDDNNETELPHQPYHSSQPVPQVVIALSQPIQVICIPQIISDGDDSGFPILNDKHLASGYLSRIFHPPIV
ncbi:MAG: hypothetical protein H6550_12785 [Chitinophagales bacterium]|nr:hypothetical protein [Chitinophagales bacterium]